MQALIDQEPHALPRRVLNRKGPAFFPWRVERVVWPVVRLGRARGGLNYFSRLSELEGRLSGIPGCKVDVVEEPVRKKRFQTEIDRDRILAF
jgi:hypothetical protein